MPHVIVKLWPGESKQKKQRLAVEIAKDAMDVLNCGEESVSLSMEEIDSQDSVKRCLQAGYQRQVAVALQEAGIQLLNIAIPAKRVNANTI